MACYAGLDRYGEVAGPYRQHLVHLGEIDAYAAVYRPHMRLHRGAGTKADDGNAFFGASADHEGGFLCGLHEHHRITTPYAQPEL